MVASHAKVSEGQVGVSMCSESVCVRQRVRERY